jgi:hypothetical protein
MGKISNTGSYPIVTPEADDLIIITDKSDNDATKNIEISGVGNAIGIGAYKTYSALITQQGGGDPTAVVLNNELDPLFKWGRLSQGTYQLTSSNAAFSQALKVQIWINYGSPTSDGLAPKAKVASPSQVIVTTQDETGVLEDDILEAAPIEIRVYQ